jgi:DNA-binding NarL/FixJ family response regulator
VLRPKVLLVDDRRENLIALTEVFRDVEVDVVWASSGNEAVKKTLSDDFALILMDVQMPNMDGYEAVEFIRREEKNRSTPILFVSAVYSDDLYKIKGVQAGAVDFIVKPVDEALLLGKVRIFLELHEHKRQLAENNQALEEARRELEAANAELERRVAERTDELARKNIALREMLYQIENEKEEIEASLRANVETVILPGLQRAKEMASIEGTETFDLIERGLDELLSPFGTRITDPIHKLTPREVEICGMIRQGLASKKIADLLNLSFGTVEAHRHNIRKKLGLSSKKTNLTNYLRSL